ncbi:MAG: di-heme oxidoredictase family protein, partial [Candidatus Methylomirabilales bacterium]
TPDGKAIVRLFSDLKRHNMGSLLEKKRTGGTRGKKPQEEQMVEQGDLTTFITAKLWGVGSAGFWLHDGSATTLTEAILRHGGEAEQARDQFATLSDTDQQAVVEFLKSLVAPVFFQP